MQGRYRKLRKVSGHSTSVEKLVEVLDNAEAVSLMHKL